MPIEEITVFTELSEAERSQLVRRVKAAWFGMGTGESRWA